MKPIFLLIGIPLLVLISSCARQPLKGTEPRSPTPGQSLPSLAVSERGSPAEAKAMLQKAVDHYNSVGREQALSDFNHQKEPFGDRDLYVVCIGSNYTLTANGGFPKYVGLSPDILKDAEGKPVGKSIWETGNSKGEGSVKYMMTNPVSHKIEPKITFVRKVGSDVCGVGAYNP